LLKISKQFLHGLLCLKEKYDIQLDRNHLCLLR